MLKKVASAIDAFNQLSFPLLAEAVLPQMEQVVCLRGKADRARARIQWVQWQRGSKLMATFVVLMAKLYT